MTLAFNYHCNKFINGPINKKNYSEAADFILTTVRPL